MSIVGRWVTTVAVLLTVGIGSAGALHAQVLGNLLEIEPTQAAPGTNEHHVSILGHNVEDIGGYTIVVAYDPLYIEAVDGNLEGTLAELSGAEFVNYQDYPDEGFFILGVLLDLLPPYEGQVIPAVPELDLVFANFICNIKPAAVAVDAVELSFEDGLGSPPLSNMFVVGVDSIAPSLTSGLIEIVDNVPFVRGDANLDDRHDVADAVTLLGVLTSEVDPPTCLDILDINDDGAIEISDAIYLLSFLFQEGPAIPAPYSTADLDPTPDDLLCD